MNYKRETRKGDRQAVKIALYGILLSLAMLLGYVETLVPISLGIPGVKLGLANLVNIVSLYLIGTGGTIAIALARIVLLTGFAYGNMAMMIYSLAGGALSLALMIFCKISTFHSREVLAPPSFFVLQSRRRTFTNIT